jgi:ABC-type phosphate transport system substrate-binding protein
VVSPIGRVAWRVLAANNRPLGRSAQAFTSIEECLNCALALHREAADVGVAVLFSSSDGHDDSSSRPYAYLPLVGGGTSFPYQIKVGGKPVTNLRLSGETLAKIFTGKISNWNDDAITKDNNGRRLPTKPIIPVVHSEGAGSTVQFTSYLASMFPTLWTEFNDGSPAMTEYYRSGSTDVVASPTDLASYQRASSNTPFAVVAVALLGLALVTPPLLTRRLAGRKGK